MHQPRRVSGSRSPGTDTGQQASASPPALAVDTRHGSLDLTLHAGGSGGSGAAAAAASVRPPPLSPPPPPEPPDAVVRHDASPPPPHARRKPRSDSQPRQRPRRTSPGVCFGGTAAPTRRRESAPVPAAAPGTSATPPQVQAHAKTPTTTRQARLDSAPASTTPSPRGREAREADRQQRGDLARQAAGVSRQIFGITHTAAEGGASAVAEAVTDSERFVPEPLRLLRPGAGAAARYDAVRLLRRVLGGRLARASRAQRRWILAYETVALMRRRRLETVAAEFGVSKGGAARLLHALRRFMRALVRARARAAAAEAQKGLESLALLGEEKAEEAAAASSSPSPPPLSLLDQGDEELCTAENMAKRGLLVQDASVRAAIAAVWEASPRCPRPCCHLMDKQVYQYVTSRCVEALLGHGCEQRRALRYASEDWEKDSHGRFFMGYPQFFEAMFALVDMWCLTVDAEEYADMARRIADRLAKFRRAFAYSTALSLKHWREWVDTPAGQARHLLPENQAALSAQLSPRSGGGGGGGSGGAAAALRAAAAASTPPSTPPHLAKAAAAAAADAGEVSLSPLDYPFIKRVAHLFEQGGGGGGGASSSQSPLLAAAAAAATAEGGGALASAASGRQRRGFDLAALTYLGGQRSRKRGRSSASSTVAAAAAAAAATASSSSSPAARADEKAAEADPSDSSSEDESGGGGVVRRTFVVPRAGVGDDSGGATAAADDGGGGGGDYPPERGDHVGHYARRAAREARLAEEGVSGEGADVDDDDECAGGDAGGSAGDDDGGGAAEAAVEAGWGRLLQQQQLQLQANGGSTLARRVSEEATAAGVPPVVLSREERARHFRVAAAVEDERVRRRANLQKALHERERQEALRVRRRRTPAEQAAAEEREAKADPLYYLFAPRPTVTPVAAGKAVAAAAAADTVVVSSAAPPSPAKADATATAVRLLSPTTAPGKRRPSPLLQRPSPRRLSRQPEALYKSPIHRVASPQTPTRAGAKVRLAPLLTAAAAAAEAATCAGDAFAGVRALVLRGLRLRPGDVARAVEHVLSARRAGGGGGDGSSSSSRCALQVLDLSDNPRLTRGSVVCLHRLLRDTPTLVSVHLHGTGVLPARARGGASGGGGGHSEALDSLVSAMVLNACAMARPPLHVSVISSALRATAKRANNRAGDGMDASMAAAADDAWHLRVQPAVVIAALKTLADACNDLSTMGKHDASPVLRHRAAPRVVVSCGLVGEGADGGGDGDSSARQSGAAEAPVSPSGGGDRDEGWAFFELFHRVAVAALCREGVRHMQRVEARHWETSAAKALKGRVAQSLPQQQQQQQSSSGRAQSLFAGGGGAAATTSTSRVGARMAKLRGRAQAVAAAAAAAAAAQGGGKPERRRYEVLPINEFLDRYVFCHDAAKCAKGSVVAAHSGARLRRPRQMKRRMQQQRQGEGDGAAAAAAALAPEDLASAFEGALRRLGAYYEEKCRSRRGGGGGSDEIAYSVSDLSSVTARLVEVSTVLAAEGRPPALPQAEREYLVWRLLETAAAHGFEHARQLSYVDAVMLILMSL